MTFSLRPLALGLTAGLALVAAPARADLVVLSSGRVMSASSVVLTDDTADHPPAQRRGSDVRSLARRRASTRTRRRGSTRPAPRSRTTGEPGAGRRRRRRSAPSRFRAAYRAIITRLAEAHGVDARLIHAVISVESALSAAGALRRRARAA